jgi:hypothetical protein
MALLELLRILLLLKAGLSRYLITGQRLWKKGFVAGLKSNLQ